jgi:hypothetical protein
MAHRASPANGPGLLRCAVVIIIAIPCLVFVVITALGLTAGGAP